MVFVGTVYRDIFYLEGALKVANKKISTEDKLAAKNYEVSDYQSNTELENGLAVTHEQVSDVYMEGTVDAVIENYQGTGEDVKIPEEGYEQD